MNIEWMKVRVRADTEHFAEMRVLPLECRNIRNNIKIYENIYIKHIDKQHIKITKSRNMPERTGTFFKALFRKCSGNPVSRNIATDHVIQGL